MGTFAQKSHESQGRAATDGLANKESNIDQSLQLADERPAAVAQRAMAESLNQSPKVQSQLQLQRMFDQSPRVVSQRKLAEAVSARKSALQMKQTVQRQDALEDEELVQQQASLEDEEPLQGKFEPIQQEAIPEEEEPLQGKFETAQRETMPEEEEPLQSKAAPVQREDGLEDEEPLQGKSEPLQKENRTGLPDELKAGVENLSGLPMDDVKVHYNSAEPATVQALAYTKGTDIHVGPGQEQHLAHEAWHVAQQKQGRVKPTIEVNGVSVNDDTSLESEADRMGADAERQPSVTQTMSDAAVAQRFEPVTQRSPVKAAQIIQRAGNVVQRDGAWDTVKEAVTTGATKLWELIKLAHTTKAAPLILNSLNLMTAAIRYALTDNSVGAQFGTVLLSLLTALEAAWTAVEEWNAATGEGKALWDKRVNAIEKVTSSLIIAASIFALPFNPTISGAIAGIGTASVKVLRSGYDFFANRFWGAPAEQQGGANYGTL